MVVMKICLVPLKTVFGDPERNFQEIDTRLREASSYKPDMICFPECALTGYMYEKADLEKFSESLEEVTITRIRESAKAYSTAICLGMIERDIDLFFNTAIVINNNGAIVHKYRKVSEKPPYSNGKEISTFEYLGFRMRVLICGDLFTKEAEKSQSPAYDLQIIPMSRSFAGKSPDSGRWENSERMEYLKAVKSTGVTSLIVNALDVGSEFSAFGGAFVVDGNGKLIIESPHGSDETVYFEAAI